MGLGSVELTEVALDPAAKLLIMRVVFPRDVCLYLSFSNLRLLVFIFLVVCNQLGCEF